MKRRFIAGVLVLSGWLCSCSPAPPPLADIPRLDTAVVAPPAAAQLAAASVALDADQRNPDRNGQLAMLCQAYQLLPEAAALYRRAQQLDPARFEWTYLHGVVLTALGRHEPAIGQLQAALELRPDYPAAMLHLAQSLYATGDPEAARQQFVALIERNPAYARAQAAYGEFLNRHGDPRAAVQPLLTALALSNRFGAAHGLLVEVYRELGEYEKVALHTRLHLRYRDFSPGSGDPVMARVEALNLMQDTSLDRAAWLLGSGRPAEAAVLLEAHLQENPADQQAHINLIAAYAELGDFDRAEEHVAAASAINADSLELLDNTGVLRMRQGRLGDAREAFLSAVRIDVDYATPHKNLGQLYESRGRLREAIEAYQRAVALDPFDNEARFFLARALVDTQRAAEAIEVISPITGYPHPELSRYLLVLGRALERAGDLAEAETAYRRTIVAARARGLGELATDASARLAAVRERRDL